MIRLTLLATAALLLPNIGVQPFSASDTPANATASFTASAAAVADVSVRGFPFPGFHIPNFIKNRKRGIEVEVNEMKTRLRDLVVQQESWYAAHNAYGRNVALVAAVAPGDSSARDVQIQILFANSRGWSAIASHPNAPGRSCVAYVGLPEALPIIPRTRLEANEALLEGIPACDSK